MACEARPYPKDRMRKLVESKSLELDDLDNLPTCESCLKGNMTKKSFVGQSTLASSLLDLIHTDVCGPVNTLARGGYSYFITFIVDHSRYGYVCRMRYNFEAFGRFKEYILEVENQTGHKIKAHRSHQGRECLNGEFIDYLNENGILSQWTPPRTPQLNGVGYAVETAAKLLNLAPSRQYPRHHMRYGIVNQRITTTYRYGFLGTTSQLDNDPRTYGEAMQDIDFDKWLEAMRSEMDPIGSNQVWTLIDPPKGVKPVGSK
ncbi:UNVERIFIED_CONTAM: Retrovirus-related Pol polyprotein from transposon TNT 1-94 [Sesamum calycinum]|uniref:Retrovirus-related Pol polyprotein from transposon TNT 1-94 n=1 Tax=Sesamum calycinum TaxID=2727403 RepID=A0AAW2RP37_9LAMI